MLRRRIEARHLPPPPLHPRAEPSRAVRPTCSGGRAKWLGTRNAPPRRICGGLTPRPPSQSERPREIQRASKAPAPALTWGYGAQNQHCDHGEKEDGEEVNRVNQRSGFLTQCPLRRQNRPSDTVQPHEQAAQAGGAAG